MVWRAGGYVLLHPVFISLVAQGAKDIFSRAQTGQSAARTYEKMSSYHLQHIPAKQNFKGNGVLLFISFPINEKTPWNQGVSLLEQETGVEPAFQAWEARVLPMYYSCIFSEYSSILL